MRFVIPWFMVGLLVFAAVGCADVPPPSKTSTPPPAAPAPPPAAQSAGEPAPAPPPQPGLTPQPAPDQPAKAGANADGKRAKILTWNVNYGGPGMDEAVKILNAADADIVCLQETTNEWEKALRAGLKDRYPHIEFRESGAGGQGFLSKTAFETVKYIEPEAPDRTPGAAQRITGWFAGWIVKTQSPAGPLQILNVHLRPPCDQNNQFTLASLQTGGQVHRHELSRFTPALAKDLPAIVLGDFNENDGDLGMKSLIDAKFQDALAAHDAISQTWHWRYNGINLTGRYDHILHPAAFRCLTARVITQGQSDHYPVVAEFVAADK